MQYRYLLVSRIYKNSYKSICRSPITQSWNNLVKKWANDLKRNFTNDDIQMPKKRFTSLIIRAQQTTTVKYCYTHSRITEVKQADVTMS